MNELSTFIFVVLQFVLWIAIFNLAFTRIVSFFFPQAKWHKRILLKAIRLFLLAPFKKFYQVCRWLAVRVFTTRPDYRLQQVHLENYPATPLEFYNAVEEVMTRRQIIGVEISRIARFEWHLLSARRIYLVIRFRDAVCFISAVPLGTSFLVSWRFAASPGKFLLILFQVPFAGVIAERLFKPPTFYRADVYHAFEQAIRATILEAARLPADRVITPLAENEQRPLLAEFYDR